MYRNLSCTDYLFISVSTLNLYFSSPRGSRGELLPHPRRRRPYLVKGFGADPESKLGPITCPTFTKLAWMVHHIILMPLTGLNAKSEPKVLDAE